MSLKGSSLFVELLKMGLGRCSDLSYTPLCEEWSEAFEIAYRQSVAGMCFEGVSRIYDSDGLPESIEFNMAHGTANLTEETYYRLASTVLSIQESNESVDSKCIKVQKIIADAGLGSSIIKGQGLTSYYGDLAHLRHSGDIDILVDAEKDKIIEFVLSKCPDAHTIMSHHFVMPVFKNVGVEVHFKPAEMCSPFAQRRFMKWYQSMHDNVYNNSVALSGGDCIVAPGVEFNLVFILLHIYKHLFAEGIGLKQVVDYYFVLKASDTTMRAKAFETIKSLKMDRFAGALMYVLQETCGLEDYFLICPVDKKEGKWLLNDILENGNKGQGREIRLVRPDDGAWFRFRTMTAFNLRLLTHYPQEALWFPFFKIWHYPWRKHMERVIRKKVAAV